MGGCHSVVGSPTGYVLVEKVDGNAHVEQLSVNPDHQGRESVALATGRAPQPGEEGPAQDQHEGHVLAPER
jgi:hypothetical protein